MKLNFLIIGTLLLINCEPVTFENFNNKDQSSSNFRPDSTLGFTAELVEQLSLPYFVNDVIRLEWEDNLFEEYYSLHRINSFGERTIVANLDQNSTYFLDTVKTGGNYTYELSTIGVDSSKSFVNQNIPHLTFGPQQNIGSDFNNFIELNKSEAILIKKSSYSNSPSVIYNYTSNSFRSAAVDPSNRTNFHLLSNNRILGLNIYGFSFYNIESDNWSTGTNWGDDVLGYGFYSIHLSDTEILIIMFSGKTFLFNANSRKLTSIEDLDSATPGLIKINEEELLMVVGASASNSPTGIVKKFSVKTKTWEILPSLENPTCSTNLKKISETEILVAGRSTDKCEGGSIQIYNFDTGETTSITEGYLNDEYGSLLFLHKTDNPYIFKLDSKNLIFFTRWGVGQYDYHIIDLETNKISKKISFYIDNDQLHGLIGNGFLENGSIFLPTGSVTFFFRKNLN